MTTLPPDAVLLPLVEAMAAGDREALRSFHEAAGPWVYGMLLRLCADEATGARVLARSFAELWRQAPLYDRHLGPPLLWALATARGLALGDKLAGGPAPQAEVDDALLAAFYRPAERPDPEAVDAALRARVEQP